MFDEGDELTNEEILELMSKPNPHGLEPFGPDWEKEMDMHPLFMDDVPQEVIDGTLDAYFIDLNLEKKIISFWIKS